MKKLVITKLIILFFAIFTIALWNMPAHAGYNYINTGLDLNAVVWYSYKQPGCLYALSDFNLYCSRDAGKTWSKISDLPVWQAQIAGGNDLFALMGASEKELSICKYSPADKQWVKICTAPAKSRVFSVLPDNSFLVGKQSDSSSYWEIYYSKDGRNWNISSYDYGGKFFAPAPDGTVFTAEYSTGYLSKSTDYGNKWKMISRFYSFSKIYVSPDFSNDKTVFGLANGNRIYCSRDSGENWALFMNGIDEPDTFVDICFSPNYASDRTVYAADKTGRIFVSKGGTEWYSLGVKLTDDNKLNNIAVLPDGSIFSGTEKGVYELTFTEMPISDNLEKVKVEFRVGSLTYKINGKEWYMDAATYIKNSRTFVPVRYLAYALGIDESNIKWDEPTKEVTILKDNITVKLRLNERFIAINGKTQEMDVYPEVNNGRIMLPARWVAEAFGAKVGWDEKGQIVVIEYYRKPKYSTNSVSQPELIINEPMIFED